MSIKQTNFSDNQSEPLMLLLLKMIIVNCVLIFSHIVIYGYKKYKCKKTRDDLVDQVYLLSGSLYTACRIQFTPNLDLGIQLAGSILPVT